MNKAEHEFEDLMISTDHDYRPLMRCEREMMIPTIAKHHIRWGAYRAKTNVFVMGFWTVPR